MDLEVEPPFILVPIEKEVRFFKVDSGLSNIPFSNWFKRVCYAFASFKYDCKTSSMSGESDLVSS